MRAALSAYKPGQWRASDGYILRGRCWITTPARINPIIYLHGIQSHGGWYEWSASVLAAAERAVVVPDRRGSGLNVEHRGDTPSAEQLLVDLDTVVTWCNERLGCERVDLVGVSWGGKLALAWALRRPKRVGRLLLVAPGIVPAVGVSWRCRMRIAAALAMCPGRLFELPLNDPRLFTSNTAGQEFIAQDELKLTRATARFLYESRRMDRWLARVSENSLEADTTLLLAGRDQIIKNSATRAWVERISEGSVQVQEFAHADHTVEFEADVAGFEKVLAGWASG